MNGWKKRLPALIICCMLGLLIGCSAQEAEKTPDAVPSAVPAEDVKETGEKTGRYTPGTYEGTAVGMNGEVRVRVTFDEDAITEVEIVEHVETPLISDLALSRIPEEIVAFQSLYQFVGVCNLIQLLRQPQKESGSALIAEYPSLHPPHGSCDNEFSFDTIFNHR